MINERKEIHIDLRLPRGWNQCTTEQLELIAATIMRHTLRQDRYHPFDWLAVKTELFFLLTETHPLPLPIMEGSSYPASTDEEQQPLMVAFNDRRPWWKKVITPSHTGEGRGRGPFPLYAWQVHSFIDQHLAWLDDEKAQPLIVFPYKRLLAYHVAVLRWLPLSLGRWTINVPYPWMERRYRAPQELLQDFGWKPYSHLQEYMESYIRQQNQLLKAQEGGKGDRRQISNLKSQIPTTRDNFLAVLFHCEHRRHRVRTISNVQFQVILFWWSGFMQYLQEKYPHCFHKAAPKKGRKRYTTPLDAYVNITATIQKDSKLSEEQINAQTFHVVLEELERMAKEAEEMERISKKHGK